MDKILANAHLRPALVRGTDMPTSQTWLERLHNNVAHVIAPHSPVLTGGVPHENSASSSGENS